MSHEVSHCCYGNKKCTFWTESFHGHFSEFHDPLNSDGFFFSRIKKELQGENKSYFSELLCADVWFLSCQLQLERQHCRKLENQSAELGLLCLWPTCVFWKPVYFAPLCFLFSSDAPPECPPQSSATDILPDFDQRGSSLCPEDTGPNIFWSLFMSPWNSTEVSLLFTSLWVVTRKAWRSRLHPLLPPRREAECRYSRSALRDHFGFGPFFLLTATLFSYHRSVLYLDCLARIIQEILMFVVVCCMKNSSSRNSVCNLVFVCESRFIHLNVNLIHLNFCI